MLVTRLEWIVCYINVALAVDTLHEGHSSVTAFFIPEDGWWCTRRTRTQACDLRRTVIDRKLATLRQQRSPVDLLIHTSQSFADIIVNEGRWAGGWTNLSINHMIIVLVHVESGSCDCQFLSFGEIRPILCSSMTKYLLGLWHIWNLGYIVLNWMYNVFVGTGVIEIWAATTSLRSALTA